MAKFTLYSLLSKALPLCDSHNQRKRVFSRVYHFCEKNRELEIEEFYELLGKEKRFLRDRDYKHSSNPKYSKAGEEIYNGLESFSFQIDSLIPEEKLKEVRGRELSFIKDLDYGKEN